MAIQCVFVYFCVANGGLRRNPIDSENPSDLDLQKNCWNPTTFGFKLHNIPTKMCTLRVLPLLQQLTGGWLLWFLAGNLLLSLSVKEL